MAAPGLTFHFQSPEWKDSLLLPEIRKLARRVVSAVLKAEKVRLSAKTLSVVFADDAFVRELNHTYRGKDKPTNILSFAGEGEHLGDMALACETIVREAEEQGKLFTHHLAHLLVHGTLHLLGYDHELDKEAEAMEDKEITILATLGIDNPYETG
jgi:probable rRNA maturation factor